MPNSPRSRSRSTSRRDGEERPAGRRPSSRREAAAEEPKRSRSGRKSAAAKSSSRRALAADASPRASRSSSRRAAAVEESAPSSRSSSRRAPASQESTGSRSTRTKGKPARNDKSANSSRRSAANDNGSSRRRGGTSTGKKIVTYVILGVIVLAAIGLMLTPMILRSVKASALAEATGQMIDQAAQDYLIQVDYQPGYISSFYSDYPDAPLANKLRLVELANELTEGRVAHLDVLMSEAANPTLPTTERTQILNLAATIFHDDLHGNTFVPRSILKWANPDGDVSPEIRDQAEAAMALLVQLNGRQELRVDETFTDIAGNPSQDSTLVEAAMGHLADILTSRNVGYGLNLLMAANADVASRNDKLLGAIYNNVRANEIATILRLWESPIDKIASFGYRAIGAPGVILGKNDTKQREELGSRVSGTLSTDLLRSSEERFGGLLDAVTNLGLSGTREQIILLTPEMSAELQSKVAKAVASFVRDSLNNDAQKAANTATLNALTNAFGSPDRSAMAIEALGQVKAGSTNLALRSALEGAVSVADQPGAIEAIHHVVDTLYKRKDVITALGDDAVKWQAYIAEDRPRFMFYEEATQWFEANKGRTRIADGDIKENRAKAEEVQPELQTWIEGDSSKIPLGLTKSQVERFHLDVNKFKKELIQSDIN